MDKDSMNKQTRAIMFNALGRDFMLINIIATFSNLVTLTLISTGNIGCMMQIANGINIPIVHTVELIDWYTGGPKPRSLNLI